MKITLKKERKAISPIIATVLIIAATLIAFAAIGGYVFGIFGTGTNTANVQVTAVNLKAVDFGTASLGVAFACTGTTSSLALTNTGTAAAAVTGVTLTWGGQTSSYASPATPCNVGAAGSTTAVSTLYFASAKIAVAPAVGQAFTGTVTLSNGAILTLTGTWQ